MYGCLMESVVKCGRTDLSRTLGDLMPSLDIKADMSLIRAAEGYKDVNAAFAVLKKLQASGASLGIAAYNSVLNICVSEGDMRRARSLMEEMQCVGPLDVVSYNALLRAMARCVT